jgi:hypothetical protein
MAEDIPKGCKCDWVPWSGDHVFIHEWPEAWDPPRKDEEDVETQQNTARRECGRDVFEQSNSVVRRLITCCK